MNDRLACMISRFKSCREPHPPSFIFVYDHTAFPGTCASKSHHQWISQPWRERWISTPTPRSLGPTALSLDTENHLSSAGSEFPTNRNHTPSSAVFRPQLPNLKHPYKHLRVPSTRCDNISQPSRRAAPHATRTHSTVPFLLIGTANAFSHANFEAGILAHIAHHGSKLTSAKAS